MFVTLRARGDRRRSTHASVRGNRFNTTCLSIIVTTGIIIMIVSVIVCVITVTRSMFIIYV